MFSIEPLIKKWHEDRNLIEGATALQQTDKLLEEFIEVVAAQMPNTKAEEIAEYVITSVRKLLNNNRIKTVLPENAQAEYLDGIGDMGIVLVNLATREGTTFNTCMFDAFQVIKHRKGEMFNGEWIKEEDLKNVKR